MALPPQAQTYHVTIMETTAIPEHQEVHLQAQLVKPGMPWCKLEQDFTGLMEPATKFTEKHGLLVARSILTSKNGLTIIRSLNPSITVHQFERIGTFHSMEVTAVHIVDATGPEIVATTPTQEDINVAIGKMMSGSEDLSCAESDKLKKLLASYIDVIADLGRTSKLRHNITTDGSPPVSLRADYLLIDTKKNYAAAAPGY